MSHHVPNAENTRPGLESSYYAVESAPHYDGFVPTDENPSPWAAAMEAPIAMPDDERAALWDEAEWLVRGEVEEVLAAVLAAVKKCLGQRYDAEDGGTAAARTPVRGGAWGDDEEGLGFQAVVGPCALRALQLRGLSFAKLNRGAPVEALWAGGAEASSPIDELLLLKNKLAQAATALEARDATPQEGGVTLQRALKSVMQCMVLLPDIVSALTRPAPPARPDKWGALRLRPLLRPPLPADVSVHACVCGSPPRLWVSAYLLKPAEGGGGGGGGGSGSGSGGGAKAAAGERERRGAARPKEEPPEVVEAHHASAELEGLAASIAELERCVELCRGVRSKLKPLCELLGEDLRPDGFTPDYV